MLVENETTNVSFLALFIFTAFAALPIYSKRFGCSSQNAANVGHGTFLLKGIYIRFDNVI